MSVMKRSVSVIIPCFNAERFLTETIESVLEQDIFRIQVIAVDDGSTDRTSAVLAKYQSRIKVISQANEGASAARNRGTAVAEGEFIQYLDADDLLLPGSLRSKRDALAESRADVAYGDWQRLEEATDGVFRLGVEFRCAMEDIHPDPEVATFTDFWSPPAALLYRRSIVERIGGWNLRLPVIQDARFLQDAALSGARFIHVPTLVALYRVHRGASLSRSSARRFMDDVRLNAEEIQSIWEGRGTLTGARRDALAQVLGHVARFYFEHNRPEFRRVLFRLKMIDPHYRPTSPQVLRFLSGILGYPGAELVSFWYRRLKRSAMVGQGSKLVQ